MTHTPYGLTGIKRQVTVSVFLGE